MDTVAPSKEDSM